MTENDGTYSKVKYGSPYFTFSRLSKIWAFLHLRGGSLPPVARASSKHCLRPALAPKVAAARRRFFATPTADEAQAALQSENIGRALA